MGERYNIKIEEVGDREFIVTRGKKKVSYVGYVRETVLRKEREIRNKTSMRK